MSNSRKCPECAESIGTEVAVCPYCGSRLTINAATTVSGQPSFFNPVVASLWSILLTPAFGAYIVRKNWQSAGETAKAQTASLWFWGVLISSLILLFFWMFSAWLLILPVWFFCQARPQMKFLRDKYPMSPRRSSVKPVIIGLVIYLGVCFCASWMLGNEPIMDCSSRDAFQESCVDVIAYLAEEGKELEAKEFTGTFTDADWERVKDLDRAVNRLGILAIYGNGEDVQELDGMTPDEVVIYFKQQERR